MAHHRLGHSEEARKWLEKANTSIDQAMQGKPSAQAAAAPGEWAERLELLILRSEAESLITGKKTEPEK
jgi:hypothetical protein